MDEAEHDQCLVDTNVLVYATVDAAPLCDEARTWMSRLQRQEVQLCVIPQIYREYLVVLTRDLVFGREFSCEEALGVLSELHPSLQMLPTGEAVWDELSVLLRRYDVAGKRIHDANVVAAMRVNDVSALATYNRQDFEQFEAITLLSAVDDQA